jgi:hypothetical protein
MNNKIIIHLIFCLALITLGCSKDHTASQKLTQSEQASVSSTASNVSSQAVGAAQFSGVGFFDATDVCSSLSQGATYAVKMTGDLDGCLYIFVDEFECSPSGTYREVGRELFVGTYNGGSGSFRTTYKFESRYEGCSVDGSYLGLEIFGRCQHPIVDGSGDGVFLGVTGRLDMKDDIEAGNYPYRGHIGFN